MRRSKIAVVKRDSRRRLYNQIMQTAPKKSSERQQARPATARRRGPEWSMILLGIGFFAAYMFFARQMESITFDTTYIATYCTFLSVFVVRCFMTAFGPHRQYK